MEEDYQKALELIFANGYGGCVYKHNIRGDQLDVPDDMPDSSNPLPLEFFANPRCFPAPTTTGVVETEVDLNEAAKEPEKSGGQA